MIPLIDVKWIVEIEVQLYRDSNNKSQKLFTWCGFPCDEHAGKLGLEQEILFSREFDTKEQAIEDIVSFFELNEFMNYEILYKRKVIKTSCLIEETKDLALEAFERCRDGRITPKEAMKEIEKGIGNYKVASHRMVQELYASRQWREELLFKLNQERKSNG